MDVPSHQPQDYIGFDQAARPPASDDVLLSPEEIRLLGCLIEKERTTPDDYPLTANALLRACNQSTSRDPVVDYDQRTVEATAEGLKSSGLLRFVHSTTGRNITRFRQVVDERFGLDAAETALVGLLMLRGPQTITELRTRSERLHAFSSLEDVTATLQRLAARDRGFAVLLERQPGQKEARWTHALGGEPVVASTTGGGASAGSAGASTAGRIAELEAQVAALTASLAEVRAELGMG